MFKDPVMSDINKVKIKFRVKGVLWQQIKCILNDQTNEKISLEYV